MCVQKKKYLERLWCVEMFHKVYSDLEFMKAREDRCLLKASDKDIEAWTLWDAIRWSTLVSFYFYLFLIFICILLLVITVLCLAY